MQTETMNPQMEDVLVMICLRNEFYKRMYRLLLGVYLLSLVVIVILLCVLVYLVKHPSLPLYFVADDVGRLIQDMPVQQPNLTNDQVAVWVADGVQAAYSYNYVNYRSQLQEAQKYFTDYGWSNYMRGLTSSNNLLALTQRNMIVTAKIVDTPKLIVEGPLGRYGAIAWKFQMPVLVTYMLPPYDGSAQFENPLQVTVIVQRQPMLQSYDGLGIVQMVGTLVSNPQPQTMPVPSS